MKFIIRFFAVIFLLTTLFATVYSQEGNMTEYEVKLEDFNSKYSDFSAIYFEDEVIYVSDRKSNLLINRFDNETGRYFCNYFTPGNDSEIQTLIDHLNTRFHEGPLTINKEKNLVFFTRTSEGKDKNLDIYYVKYKDGSWSDEHGFPVNDSRYSTGHPSLSYNDKYLYFVSDMPGGFGGTDIYRIAYNDGEWGEPENLGPNINTSYDEVFPFISENNTLYFSSDIKSGEGGLDIYKAKKVDGEFQKRTILGEPFNTRHDDFALYFKLDSIENQIGFFSSDRPGGLGVDDVYAFKSLFEPLRIAGKVMDYQGDTIAGAKMVFTDNEDNQSVTYSDEEGVYQLEALRGHNYEITATHEDYRSVNYDLSTPENKNKNLLNFDIKMPKHILFTCQPVNNKGDILNDVHVKMYLDDEEIFSGMTDDDGIVWEYPEKYKQGEEIALQVDCNKEGYKKTILNVDKVITDAQVIMEKEPEDIAEVPEEETDKHFKPIYFDFDDYSIPKGVFEQLDKIISYLNNNPDKTVKVSAHADSRGSDAYNIKLSEKRVKSVIDYLRSDLDNPYQVYGEGYGENKLTNHCEDGVECTEDEHAQNRRAEFEIKLKPYLPIVYHDFDEAELIEEYYKRLDYIIDYMNAHPEVKVEFSSHTDSWGEADYNMKLSQERAEEIQNYMQERLDNPEQISGKGYGETQLVNECDDDTKCTKAQYAKNRRTEFEIVESDE